MLNYFLNLIFPKTCLNCGFSENYLCDFCKLKLINVIEKRKCKICSSDLKSFHCCSIKKDFFSLLDYQNEVSSKLIRSFKYQYLTDLVEEVFSGLLKEFWTRYNNFFDDDFIIVPIPIHYKKKNKRGFNQSELIAKKLSFISGLENIDDLLIRMVNNKSQVGSGNILERQKNTEGIFEINYRKISGYYGRSILLIDDVYTTGCTINEAKIVLMGCGFKKIKILVLAMN